MIKEKRVNSNIEFELELPFGEMYRPEYNSKISSGMNVRARIKNLDVKNINDSEITIKVGDFIYGTSGVKKSNDETLIIPVGERALIPLGIKTLLPKGYQAKINPRTFISIKHGISNISSPYLINFEYIEEWGAIVKNNGILPIGIKNGLFIGVVTFNKIYKLNIKEVIAIPSK